MPASVAKRTPKPSTPKPGKHWIRAANSAIHGRGVYARKTIPEGTRIVEYIGEKITKAESDRRELKRLERKKRGGDSSVYFFILNKRYDLDGRTSRNIARLINHSCQPNCRAENDRGHIWIIAKREIAEGEELFFDYGFSFADWREHPCRCGTKKCVGYIVDVSQRWRVKKALRAERVKKAVAKKQA